MNWDTVFALSNGWALIGWIVLIVGPRRPLALSFVMYGVVAILCLAYLAFLALAIGAPAAGPGGSFASVGGVARLLSTPQGAAVGWIHYLALDLFAGLWIARDADAKAFGRLTQAPVLLLTFLAGPVGLLVWLVVRERRARAAARVR